MDLYFLPLVGIFVGFASGFFGIGGGSIIVPIMLSFGYDIKNAIGISILQMLFSAIFGSYINYKNGKLMLDKGIFVGIGGLFGASFSGFIVSNVDHKILEFAFLFTLAFCIAKFFMSNIHAEAKNPSGLILFLIGFGIGIISISMGIGGGMFLTPILVGFLGVDIKKAISMGLFFVIFSSLSGFLSLASYELVDYTKGVIIGIGSLFGVYFGVKICNYVDRNLQKKLLIICHL